MYVHYEGDLVAGDVVCHLWHWYKERVGAQGGASMSNQSASGTMTNSVSNPSAGNSLGAYHRGHGHFHKHSFAGADTGGSMKPDGKGTTILYEDTQERTACVYSLLKRVLHTDKQSHMRFSSLSFQICLSFYYREIEWST